MQCFACHAHDLPRSTSRLVVDVLSWTTESLVAGFAFPGVTDSTRSRYRAVADAPMGAPDDIVEASLEAS
jgi:hypothetical protein